MHSVLRRRLRAVHVQRTSSSGTPHRLLLFILVGITLGAPGADVGLAWGQAPGDAGVFFDTSGTISSAANAPFIPITLWVIGFDLPGDIRAVEAALDIPPEFVVTAFLPYDQGLCTQIAPCSTFFCWACSGGTCRDASGSFLLAQVNLLSLGVTTDAEICLVPAQPSSYDPPAPGYLDCANVPRTFHLAPTGGGVYGDGCAVVNATQGAGLDIGSELGSTQVPVRARARGGGIMKPTDQDPRAARARGVSGISGSWQVAHPGLGVCGLGLACALAFCLVLAPVAVAQAPGDAGIFLDTLGTQTSGSITPFVPLDLWVVVFDPPGGIEGINVAALLPPELIGVSFTGGAVLCITLACSPTPCYFCGLGACSMGPGPITALRLTVMQISPGPSQDLTICLGGTDVGPSGVAGPSYATCGGEWREFGVAANGMGIYPDGCAVLNPTQQPPVSTPRRSWGTLKSAFGPGA